MDAKKLIVWGAIILVVLGVYFYNSRFSRTASRVESHSEKDNLLAISPKTVIAFLGAPGSGKGTLAGRIVKELGFLSVSTGDLARAEVASGTERGMEIAQYMKGGLIPDAVITDMLESWLVKNAGAAPVILDGYPRTKPQAEKLATLLSEKFPEYTLRIMYLQITDEEEVVDRISNRLVCGDCKRVYGKALMADPNASACQDCGGALTQRDDDKQEIVRARLQSFKVNNDEIMAHYQHAGVPILAIDVSHVTPEQIFKSFKKIAAQF